MPVYENGQKNDMDDCTAHDSLLRRAPADGIGHGLP